MTYEIMNLARISLFSTVCLLVSPLAGEPLPSDIQRLVKQREDAIAKIDKTFLQELDKLKLKYAKRGDLDTANQVASLMKTVSGESIPIPLPKTKEELRKGNC